MYKRIKRLQLYITLIILSWASPCVADIPFKLPPQQELNKLKSAVIFTNKGNITIELYPEEAPWHIANLKFLSDKGFYKNLKFHLFYPDYIIQGGDPKGDGSGGPGYNLPPEFGRREHVAGTFGMARIKDSRNPERLSSGSQFHILLCPAPKMDNEYTIMGKVIAGMKVVKKLRKDDRILDLVVYVRN